MNITAVSVVKNEEFYLPMMFKSVLPHVDNMYVLDTGSSDLTTDCITAFADEYSNLKWERKIFGSQDIRFDSTYDELVARNQALARVREVFNQEYIMFIDADEIYNDYFWTEVESGRHDGCHTLGHPTHVPFTQNRVATFNTAYVDWDGHRLFDPHVRIWDDQWFNQKGTPVWWVQKPGWHVILSSDKKNDLRYDQFITNPVHFHLKFMTGPKSYPFWLELKRDRHGLKQSDGHIHPDADPEIFGTKAKDYWMEKYPECFSNGVEHGWTFYPPQKNIDKILEQSEELGPKFGLPDFIINELESWQRKEN